MVSGGDINIGSIKKRNFCRLETYPDVSLKDVRNLHEKSRKLLAKGIDPSEAKKKAKAIEIVQAENSFQAAALEWIAKFSPNWTTEHAKRITNRLKHDIFPWLGASPINDIASSEML